MFSIAKKKQKETKVQAAAATVCKPKNVSQD